MPASVKFVILALGLYLMAWAAVAVRIVVLDGESTRLIQHAATLGEEHAPLPSMNMKPLQKACAGVLSPGNPRSIAAYIAGMEPAHLPRLPETYMHLDQTLVGVYEPHGLDLTTRFMEDVRTSRFWDVFKWTADPTDWMRRIEQSRKGMPEMREARYLVAARYEFLTLPQTHGKVYDGGAGAWGARVLTFPEGKVLCEGQGRVRMKGTVQAGGRGPDADAARAAAETAVLNLVPFVFTKSVVVTPLHEVCEAGGPGLCKLTSYWVGPNID